MISSSSSNDTTTSPNDTGRSRIPMQTITHLDIHACRLVVRSEIDRGVKSCRLSPGPLLRVRKAAAMPAMVSCRVSAAVSNARSGGELEDISRNSNAISMTGELTSGVSVHSIAACSKHPKSTVQSTRLYNEIRKRNAKPHLRARTYL
jgi:hypothetical protein